MDLRDLASPSLSLLDAETESFSRVLVNQGICGPKVDLHLRVDMGFGLLELVGLRSGLSCVGGFHCSRRMARPMGTPNHSSVSRPSL
jgi:hypothetical protein